MNSKLKRNVISAIAASLFGMPFYVAHAAGERTDAPRAGEKAPLADPARKAGDRDKAMAGKEKMTADRPGAAMGSTGQHVARASKLIGAEVKNAQGEKLGEIKDLVVDVRNATTHYAVLSFGGIMGIGDKLFAYPVSMLRWGPEKDELRLDVDRARLEKAPGFESASWPDWADESYRRGVDKYFEIKRPTVMGSEPRLLRASKLVGAEVKDTKNEDVGEIEDVIVSLGNGKVLYVVLDFDKAWSLDDKLIPLPLNALRFSTEDEGDIVITTSRDRLDTKHAFDDKHWPDLNDPSYRRDVDGYLGKRTDADKR